MKVIQRNTGATQPSRKAYREYCYDPFAQSFRYVRQEFDISRCDVPELIAYFFMQKVSNPACEKQDSQDC